MVQAVQTWQTKLKLMLFHGGSSTDAWFTMTAAQVRGAAVCCYQLCQCTVLCDGAAMLHLCKHAAWSAIAVAIAVHLWKQGTLGLAGYSTRLCVDPILPEGCLVLSDVCCCGIWTAAGSSHEWMAWMQLPPCLQCVRTAVASTVAVLKCSFLTEAVWVSSNTQPIINAQHQSHKASHGSCALQVGQALLTIPYSMAQLGMVAGVLAQVSGA